MRAYLEHERPGAQGNQAQGDFGGNVLWSVPLRDKLNGYSTYLPIECTLGRTRDCKSCAEAMWFDSIKRHQFYGWLGEWPNPTVC